MGSKGSQLSAEDNSPDMDDATEIVPVEALSAADLSLVERESLYLGAYTVERLLGEGGGGRVYAARHRDGGERVAIKVLRPEMVPLPHLVTRFNREVEAIQKIQHPGIVRVLECGQTESRQPFYVMELLEGVNLRRLLQEHGRFSPQETLQLIGPVCDALAAVHDAGFVHRDIKASNVHVSEAAGERSVKLLDFGIAKSVHGESGPGLTEPGVKLGSVHSMAPEQVRCERLDGRADIYAMGVLLFQLLTGEYPFDAADPRQIALLHLQAPAPRPSTRAPVDAALDAIVLRCLEKSADKRFASARELLRALQAAITAPQTEPDTELPALGILLQLSTPEDAELDDALMEDMANVSDQVEQLLLNHNFVFPLRAATSLLAVRACPSDANTAAERAQMLGVVQELCAALDERDQPHPALQLALSLRAGSLVYAEPPPEGEPVGGALLDLASWDATHRVSG